MLRQPPSEPGLLIIQALRSHSDTSHSVGFLWTSDQPVAETSTWQKHNTRNRQISMPSAGFEPTIPASERPQTHALDRATTGIGNNNNNNNNNKLRGLSPRANYTDRVAAAGRRS